jgi:hypothetical protein
MTPERPVPPLLWPLLDIAGARSAPVLVSYGAGLFTVAAGVIALGAGAMIELAKLGRSMSVESSREGLSP